MKNIKVNENISVVMKSLVLTIAAVFLMVLMLSLMRSIGLNIFNNSLLVNALFKSLLIIVPCLIIRKYNKGNLLSSIGLGNNKYGVKYVFIGIGMGLICGMLAFAALFLMKIGFYEGTGFKFYTSKIVIVFMITVFLRACTTAVCEEVFFRGVLLNYLSRYKGKTFGLLVSSIIFTAPHLTRYKRVDELCFVLIGGIVLGYLYVKTESLYMSVGVHFAIDFFMNLTGIKNEVGFLILRINPAYSLQYFEQSIFLLLSLMYLILLFILILINKNKKEKGIIKGNVI